MARSMKVRLRVLGDKEEETRFLRLQKVPRSGELLESGRLGTVQVVSVVHTPNKTAQDVVLVVKKME